MMIPSNETLVGWTPEDGTRGSWSIIISSLFTIIACTWTVLHPRIHVDRSLRRLHKACQLSKQILAPELETIEALQELLQARKAKACCADLTNGEMNLTQAFYVGMMGLRYRTEVEGGHRVLWPLQLAFLLETGLISWPPPESWRLSTAVIQDRSKADGLLKLFTLVQVTWFTVNCIVRSTKGMALAPLESMTLAYVVQVILTYACWWKKPKDIATATFVDLPDMRPCDRAVFDSMAMEQTYDVADPAGAAWSRAIAWYIIPRDCGETDYRVAIAKAKALHGYSHASRENAAGALPDSPIVERTISKPVEFDVFHHELERAPRLVDPELAFPDISRGLAKQDETKTVTEWDDSLYWTRWWPLVCLVACSFGAVHMISWNGHFASAAELWLWRASCIGSIVFALVTMQFKKVEFCWRGVQTVIQIGCPVLYVICRIVMVAEVVAAFRALPASTYLTYDVLNYWVHF